MFTRHSRKSSLGAREVPRVLSLGGGGSRTQYEKIRRFGKKKKIPRRITRVSKVQWGGGVVAGQSKTKSVDSAINKKNSVD